MPVPRCNKCSGVDWGWGGNNKEQRVVEEGWSRRGAQKSRCARGEGWRGRSAGPLGEMPMDWAMEWSWRAGEGQAAEVGGPCDKGRPYRSRQSIWKAMESYWRILVTYVLTKIPLLQHVKWVGEARMEAGRAVGRRLQGLQAKEVLGTMH